MPRSLLDRLVRSFAPLAYDAGLAWEPPFPDPEYDPRRVILEITRQVIREAASGDVVILGRGAAEVLRDRQDALHVFLCAPVERRIEAVMSREGLGPTEARHRVERTDANRTAYMRQVYDVAWQDPLRYAMVMNTAVLGYEPAAELILAACR